MKARPSASLFYRSHCSRKPPVFWDADRVGLGLGLISMVSPHAEAPCAICALHADPVELAANEVWRSDLWLLRHHPHPSPLAGWCLLDSLRHCGGPMYFDPAEARDWGVVVQRASLLVRKATGCERVYIIAFGEGAPHLHLHLIPRYRDDPRTTSWQVADFYRNIDSGRVDSVSKVRVSDWLSRARLIAPEFLG